MRIVATIAVSVLFSSLVPALGQGGPERGSDAPVFWSADDMRAIGQSVGSRVSPTTHMAAERLIPAALLIYRTGPSQAEAHQNQGDFISVREGEGSILVGGEIMGAEAARDGEVRGESITGGVRYPVATGDTLYVPAGVPHQFFVEEGKHWLITIVKVTETP